MEKMNVVIADDESLAREAVRELLDGVSGLHLVGECEDGEKAVEMILEKKPDLVFLDVQMPGFDGFGVLREVRRDRMPLVIFTTAYQEYAVKAFEQYAVDYLLKPIGKERFREAVNRARTRLSSRKTATYSKKILDVLNEMRPKGKFVERFVVKTRGRIVLVKARDIAWIEAAGDYVRLHVGTDHYLHRTKMNEMEKLLDPGAFARIHRSAIVNIDRIKEMQPLFSGDYSLLLFDGTKLTLSRTHRNRVLSRLS